MKQFVGVPSPGDTASDEEKLMYYTKNASTYLLKKCVSLGLRAPLDVCKRTSNNKGVHMLCFADESHMCYYLHKVYNVAIEDTLEGMVEEAFGPIEGDVIRRVQVGDLVQIVTEYATYAALVEDCYKAGENMEVELTHEAQQEAAASATNSVVVQNTTPSLADIIGLQNLQFQQQMGVTPTKYVDGVPHYQSSILDQADKWRM